MGYALQHLGYGTFTKNIKADFVDGELDPYNPEITPGSTTNDYRPGDIYTYGYNEESDTNYHV